jgi:hypothetical protein
MLFVRNLSQKPLLLIILTAYMAFTALVTGNYIFERLDHEHDGAGRSCSVCHEIALAQLLLEGLGRIGIILPIAGFVVYAKEHIKKPSLMYRAILTS